MGDRFSAGARRLRRELAFTVALRALPPRIAVFQWRAHRLSRSGDEISQTSATRPRKLATLLRLAGGRRRVVELGTASGWTAISLALGDEQRRVVSYDISRWPQLDRYLELVSPSVRSRLEFVLAPGESGPQSPEPVDLLYVDSSHDREQTIRELEAWSHVLAGGALVVFDDFAHPEYPGVREAVAELGLGGEQREGLFVHEVAAGSGAQS